MNDALHSFPSNHCIILEFKGISFYSQVISFLQISWACLTEARGCCIFWDHFKISRQSFCH